MPSTPSNLELNNVTAASHSHKGQLLTSAPHSNPEMHLPVQKHDLPMDVGAKHYELLLCRVQAAQVTDRLACSLKLVLVPLLLDVDAALAHFCLMLLALLPQALALSQESFPAVACRLYHGDALMRLCVQKGVVCMSLWDGHAMMSSVQKKDRLIPAHQNFFPPKIKASLLPGHQAMRLYMQVPRTESFVPPKL